VVHDAVGKWKRDRAVATDLQLGLQSRGTRRVAGAVLVLPLHGPAFARTGHRDCDEIDTQGEVPMYWVFVAVFTAIAFGWVTVRRRRKSDQKTA